MSYAPTEVTFGSGKRLSYSDTSSGSFTNIYGTVNIDLPEAEVAAEEIVNDDTGFVKTFIPGLTDPGTMAFSYTYGKTQFAAIETIAALARSSVAATRATATKFWKLTYPDGSTATWQGFVTKHGLPAEVESHLEVEGEMQATSVITFVAGV